MQPAPPTEPAAQTRLVDAHTRILTTDPIRSVHTDQQGQLLGVSDSGTVYRRELMNGHAVWSVYMIAPKVHRA